MRILLANNHLRQPGGTERWTETMYHALTALGMEVDVLTMCGRNKLFDAPPYDEEALYDAGFINHNSCLRYVRQHGNVGRIVFTSHGVLPELERAEEGADVYVGVSEEVAAAMPFEASVIRNPVDLEAFTATWPVNAQLRSVLFLSTHQGHAKQVVKAACRGLELKIVGVYPDVTDEVPTAINGADLVVGLGRSATEAMACSRNVVVFDYRGGDGFVTAENFDELRKRNFSGRTRSRMFTAEELRSEMDRYDPAQDLRPLVADQDAELVALRYLALV